MGSSNYSSEEVRKLIEEYSSHWARADTTRPGLRMLVRLADLDRALEQLPLEHWRVMLLHGLIGLDQYETARLLQTSQKTVAKRFRQGIEDIVYTLNGGVYF